MLDLTLPIMPPSRTRPNRATLICFSNTRITAPSLHNTHNEWLTCLTSTILNMYEYMSSAFYRMLCYKLSLVICNEFLWQSAHTSCFVTHLSALYTGTIVQSYLHPHDWWIHKRTDEFISGLIPALHRKSSEIFSSPDWLTYSKCFFCVEIWRSANLMCLVDCWGTALYGTGHFNAIVITLHRYPSQPNQIIWDDCSRHATIASDASWQIVNSRKAETQTDGSETWRSTLMLTPADIWCSC